MTYRGKVKGGIIVPEQGTKPPGEGSTPDSVDDPLFEMTSLAVDTGIPDLATNIDHYLYSHPKAGDA